MRWVGEAKSGRILTERRFEVKRANRLIPGILWYSEATEPDSPLVLIGHGASVHKRCGYVLSVARRFVKNHGFAAIAIDGPVHGDRRLEGRELDGERVHRDFLSVWAQEDLIDEMVEDWRAALRGIREVAQLGRGPVGYWGVSMGTIFGLPLLVQEPAIGAAVLGLMGAFGPTAARLAGDAGKVEGPVLFLLQWNDDLVPREYGLELFDRIASRDKRLYIYPGPHSRMPTEAFTASELFLARRLNGGK